MGKPSISEYDFTVNQDFTTVSKNLENGGRSIVRFHNFMKANNATMIGLRTVLSSMILLKIKTLFALLKKK